MNLKRNEIARLIALKVYEIIVNFFLIVYNTSGIQFIQIVLIIQLIIEGGWRFSRSLTRCERKVYLHTKVGGSKHEQKKNI